MAKYLDLVGLQSYDALMKEYIKEQGGGGGGESAEVLTQAQYDALSDDKKLNGTTYYISDQDAIGNTAEQVAYSNTTSGLVSTSVQGAIDELKASIPTAAVNSVAGRTGNVSIYKSDIGLGNVDNTSDLNKPISTATQTALNNKATTSALAAVQYQVDQNTSGVSTLTTRLNNLTIDYNNLTNKPLVNGVLQSYPSSGKTVRNAYISTSTPTSSDGVNGDLWFVYVN